MLGKERVVSKLYEYDFYPYPEGGTDYIHCFDSVNNQDIRYSLFIEEKPFIGLIIKEENLRKDIRDAVEKEN